MEQIVGAGPKEQIAKALKRHIALPLSKAQRRKREAASREQEAQDLPIRAAEAALREREQREARKREGDI